MSAKIIDGKAIAQSVRHEVAAKVQQRIAAGLRAPGLAVVLVGEDPASQVYVGSKRRACEEVGFESRSYDLPITTSQEALLALSLFFSSLRGVNSASAPLLSLCSAILWFSGFGMAGMLSLGGWLFYAASFLLGGAALWRRGGKKLLSSLATPGLGLFFAGAVVLAVWFALRQPLFSQWDEFTFWGIAAKITKTQNLLYPMVRPGFWWTMTEYPALVVLSYFAQFFGAFAPWKMYWAYGLLYFACVAALLAPFGRRHWRIAIPMGVCGLAVPFFFTVPYETVALAKTWISAYADLPGGLLLGGCLCLYFGVRQSKNGALWQVFLPLATLAVVKENVMPVALVAAGVFSADVLFFGTSPWRTAALPARPAAENSPLPKGAIPRRLLWCAGFFTAVLAPFMAWKRYAQWANVLNPNRNGNQTNDLSPTGGLAQALREILGLAPKSDPFYSSLTQLWDSFLGRVPVSGGYERGTLRVSMAGTALVTTLFILGVFLLALVLAKTPHRRKRMALAGGLLLGGWAAYHFMLFITYAYLSHKKGEGIFDYARYTTSYTVGWLFLGLLFLGLCAKWAGRRGFIPRTALLVLALFMAGRCAFLLRPGYSVLDMPPSAFAQERAQQKQVEDFAAAMEEDAHIFYVCQGDGGGLYFQWHYYLYPRVLEYSITGGGPLVPPPEGEELHPLHSFADLERIQTYLVDFNCQYILIQELDEGFLANYGSLFEDLDPSAAPALYEKTQSGLYARVA